MIFLQVKKFSLFLQVYSICSFIVVLLQELIVFSLQVTILLCVNGFIMISPLFKTISN